MTRHPLPVPRAVLLTSLCVAVLLVVSVCVPAQEPKKAPPQPGPMLTDGVVWGGIQFKDGDKKYGVRRSVFYYQPDQLPPNYYRSDLDWKSWTSWNREASEAVIPDRSEANAELVEGPCVETTLISEDLPQ